MRIFASRFSILLPFVALVALTGGCIPSKNPLSDPDEARVDSDLCGIWKYTSAKRTTLLIIGKSTVTGHPAGFMREREVSYDSDSATYSGGTDSYCFVSVLGDFSYTNILVPVTDPTTKESLSLDLPKQYERWKTNLDRRYYLRKYQVQRGKLSVWEPTDNAVAQLIDGGKLAGKVNRDKEGKVSSTSLSDSTENLAKFIKDGGDTKLFPAETKVVYTRLK